VSGSPKYKRITAVIDKYTAEMFGEDADETPLDFLCVWLESGRTMIDLAETVAKDLGEIVYAAQISQMGRKLEAAGQAGAAGPSAGQAEAAGPRGRKSRIDQARRWGAMSLAEQSLGFLDKATPKTARLAEARAKGRQWLAERFDPERFGTKQAPTTQVNLNLSGQHLAAFAQLTQLRLTQPEAQSDAIAPAIEQPAEVLSIEPASSSTTEQ
jgi:hypothetical protein